ARHPVEWTSPAPAQGIRTPMPQASSRHKAGISGQDIQRHRDALLDHDLKRIARLEQAGITERRAQLLRSVDLVDRRPPIERFGLFIMPEFEPRVVRAPVRMRGNTPPAILSR